MSSISPNSRMVHLHWVRETPTRGLTLPVSQTLTNLESIPVPVRRFLERLGEPVIELHLPPQPHVPRRDGDAWAEGLEYRRDPSGRWIGEHPNDPTPAVTWFTHQAIVLVARAAFHGKDSLTVAADPGPTPLLAPPATVFRRCDPGQGLTGAPAMRSGQYLETYKPLGAALQSAFRTWLPALHFQSLDDFTTILQAKAVLAYSSAAPVTGRRVDETSVDPLQEAMLEKACRSIPRLFPERLREVSEALRGNPDGAFAAAALSHRNAARILEEVLLQRQYLYLLFRHESALITAIIDFCANVERWAAMLREPEAVRPAYREIRRAAGAITDQLACGFQRRSHFPLGCLALVHAVRALEPDVLRSDPVDLENAA